MLKLMRLEDRCTPSGVPTSWSTRGSGGGGALFSPQINPANPSEYTIASDMSQVFRTTDAGASWQTIDFRELQGGHESRVQSTGTTGVFYSLDYSNDLRRPAKSTDGGLTWTPLANDPTAGDAFTLDADPTDANRLILSAYATLYSSGDGGQTWSARYTAPGDGAGLLVGGSFFDGSSITLGTNRGVLRSTDGGASFAIQTLGGLGVNQAIISFAGGKSGGVTRFTAVTLDRADVYAGLAGYENIGGGQVATITLGQPNWAVQAVPAGTWPFIAAMARNNAFVSYVAGGSDAGSPTVIKSTGGAWTPVLNTAGNANVATGWSGQGGTRGWGYGEFALGFTVNERDADHLLLTDLGFAHASTDGGTTWSALYVSPADRNAAGSAINPAKTYHDSGLDNTTAWQVAWAGGNVIVANSDIRGQLSTDGGQTFGFNYTGHTANSLYRVVRAGDGLLYGGTGSAHDLYQSTTLADARIDPATGGVIVSADNGVTWTAMRNFNDIVSWVAVDPSNAERLYAAVVNSTSGGIWVTNNRSAGAAATWTKLANPPRTEGHAFNVVVLTDGTLVATYSGRRTAAGAFTASSGVFVSDDGGQTWHDRSDAAMRYWTKDVVVDPFDATQSTWYVGVFSGWGGAPNGLGGLYKTTDRGQTWTRVLNLDRVTSCTFNLFDANELFVTTEGSGLWSSANIRSTAPVFTAVASYPFRQPERVFFNPQNANELWVTSFGAGVMVGVNPPLPPTTVSAVSVNLGSTQRSRVTTLTLIFSSPVDAASLGAITLTKPGVVVQTNATSGGRIVVAPQAGPTLTLTLSFNNVSGASTSNGVEYGSLSDGRWQLAIPSLSYTGTLHRLFGDWNGDGTVDGGSDFAAFGAAFGTSGVGSAFDFNNDGAIEGGTDFAAFGARFGQTV